MSSLVRNLQRKHARKGTFTTDDDGKSVHVPHEPKPQFVRSLPCGGYVTVRYTRGPLLVSGRRLRAQARLAEIQAPGAEREQVRLMARVFGAAPGRQSKVWREPLPSIAGTVTRQQVRFARRKGLPIPGAPEAPVKPKRVRKAKPEVQAHA